MLLRCLLSVLHRMLRLICLLVAVAQQRARRHKRRLIALIGQPCTAHQPRELVGVLSSAVTSNSTDTQEPLTAVDTFWWYLSSSGPMVERSG